MHINSYWQVANTNDCHARGFLPYFVDRVLMSLLYGGLMMILASISVQRSVLLLERPACGQTYMETHIANSCDLILAITVRFIVCWTLTELITIHKSWSRMTCHQKKSGLTSGVATTCKSNPWESRGGKWFLQKGNELSDHRMKLRVAQNLI